MTTVHQRLQAALADADRYKAEAEPSALYEAGHRCSRTARGDDLCPQGRRRCTCFAAAVMRPTTPAEAIQRATTLKGKEDAREKVKARDLLERRLP